MHQNNTALAQPLNTKEKFDLAQRVEDLTGGGLKLHSACSLLCYNFKIYAKKTQNKQSGHHS